MTTETWATPPCYYSAAAETLAVPSKSSAVAIPMGFVSAIPRAYVSRYHIDGAVFLWMFETIVHAQHNAATTV